MNVIVILLLAFANSILSQAFLQPTSIMVLNKKTISNASGFKGFHFYFENHPDKDQQFVTDGLNEYDEFTLNDPTVIDALFEDSSTKETLVDDVLPELRKKYYTEFFKNSGSTCSRPNHMLWSWVLLVLVLLDFPDQTAL